MADNGNRRVGNGYYQALYEFGYDEETPNLDRGQVFRMHGHVNDQKLIDLRYVVPVKPKTEVVECGECGALFLDDHARTVHGDKWHSFTCECGWQAKPSQMSAAEALRRHRLSCPVSAAARDRARAEHLQVVADIKAAG